MLVSHFLPLVGFLSSTAALPTSQWATQLVLQIAQNPLMEEPVLSAPAVSFSEQIPLAVAAPSPVSLLYQFDEMTALENLAARSNGQLILTATNKANVYSYDPPSNVTSLLYTFPESNSTLGIAEAAPDVFIVAVGNYSGLGGVPGSFSVWSMDFSHNTEKPIVKNITAISEAHSLNGMTAIEGSPDLVLIADSSLGAIWRVNITSGNYSKAIEHVYFANTTDFPIGINGIRTQDHFIFFSNSAQRLYGRIPIDKTGGASAEPEIIARSLPAVRAWDDFAIDWEDKGWIATHSNAVTQVTVGGKQRNFTLDDPTLDIQQPTSLVFGRGSPDAEKTLFVVTSGGTNTNNEDIPGQILAVDTRFV